MLKIEKKCRRFLTDHFMLIAMIAVLLTGIVVRWALIPFISGDFQNFNMPWLKEMRRIGGNAMVADGRFNYSPLFFYLFKIMGDLFPQSDAHLLCKMMSIIPEMLISLGCFYALYRMQGQKLGSSTLILFSAFWLNPILLLNAAAWGQTDCCYVLFSLLAVFLLIQKQPVWAIVALGISCCWKLQGIFLLPLFILAYFSYEKPFSLFWLLLVPFLMLLSSLPMSLMQMNPFQIFHTYFAQFGEHQTQLSLNYPNLYALLDEGTASYQLLSPLGVVLLAGAFCLCAAWMIRKKLVLKGPALMITGAWCILMCAYFLPSIHERYALAGELLLLCYALLSRQKAACIAAALCMLATLNSYTHYLASALFPVEISMLLQATVLILTTREMWLAVEENK